MEISKHWHTIQALFQQAFQSSLHYAIATVNEDGSPHVTPVGALILREDCIGFFFDEFLHSTSKNLERNKRVCVLAVNSDIAFWGKSLFDGKFDTPPAVRLMGTVGEKREATADEIATWHKRVEFTQGMRGFDILWKDMHTVRDIYFDSFEPVVTGEMTNDLWK